MKKLTVPLTHADILRDAIGKAGAGKLGNYSFCSVSTKVTGRYFPEEGATPHIGQIAKLEQVEEERIEVTCDNDVLKDVIDAIKSVHPYEEIALDVYSLEDLS